MRIIDSSFEIISKLPESNEIAEFLEKCGRVCYKSEKNISEGSAKKFIQHLIKSGHESVLEHYSVSVKLIVSRATSHQLVRHRLASFCLTGDAVVYVVGDKKWTVKELYDMQFDDERHGCLELVRLKSMDEDTDRIVENQIKKIYREKISPVIEITTRREFSIKVTKNHRMATPAGYVCAGNLRPNDLLMIDIGASKAIVDPIISIVEVGEEAVYDISMENEPFNFVANGIVVHNSQESQRYCNYSTDRFSGEVVFIIPRCFKNVTPQLEDAYETWVDAMQDAESAYLALLETLPAQDAREVLPNSTKTEMVITANLREWRHIFKMRVSPAADNGIKYIMNDVLKEFKNRIPYVFDDIKALDD